MSTVNQNQKTVVAAVSEDTATVIEGSGTFCGFTVCASGFTEDTALTASLVVSSGVYAPLPYTATASAAGVCAFTFRLNAPHAKGVAITVSGNSAVDALLTVSMYENALYLHRLGSAR